MPLPIPNKNEPKDAFISRCIETEIMNKDFPNLTQRIAVCVSQWDRKDEIKNAPKVRKNADCPDGWEHEMPDGSFMCGKKHGQTKHQTSKKQTTYSFRNKNAIVPQRNHSIEKKNACGNGAG